MNLSASRRPSASLSSNSGTAIGETRRPSSNLGEDEAGSTARPNANVRRLLAIMPLLSVAASVTMAPKIEVYTLLACSVHRPELLNFIAPTPGFSAPFHDDNFSPFVVDVQPLVLSQFTSVFGLHERSRLFDAVSVNGSLPDQHTRCSADPVVKTAVAELTTVISAVTGLLMCITTGWWGSFSDRQGRRSAMIVSTLSLLVTDLNFIFAALFTKHIPGGYWFLLIGPIADGIFGGMTIGVIAIQSYIADTTHESERSGAFSFALGLLFSGMALGPTLGSLFIHFTGSLISVFYLSAVLHGLYVVCVICLIPESLARDQMDEFRLKYFSETAATTQEDRSPLVYLLVRLRNIFSFMKPLAVFFPVRTPSNNPLKKGKKDWSLTIVIFGYGLAYCVVGSYSYKFQYATSTFGWSSEELGYWLGIVGASRALYLAVILPVVIKLFKPKPPIQKLEFDVPSEPIFLEVAVDEDSASSSSPLLVATTIAPKEAHSSAFDLSLARYSLFLEMIALAGMGLSQTSMPFSVFGALGALGAGFGPAAEAIILTLYTRRGDTEKGKLLGAVGVVQAICSQIIGPSAFGLIYMKTVALHPRTIYMATVSTVLAALFLMNIVRLPKGTKSMEVEPGAEEQDSSLLRSFADQTE